MIVRNVVSKLLWCSVAVERGAVIENGMAEGSVCLYESDMTKTCWTF